MARILVLGATGMLGHKLCQELARRNHQVIATVRTPEPRLAQLLPGVKIRVGLDVLAKGSLDKAIFEERADFVINSIGVVKQLPEASNKYISTALNAWLPHQLLAICKEHTARLIH